ncbi:MAG: LysE/ArgO family amino acid transporter [Acidiphilium sp.]
MTACIAGFLLSLSLLLAIGAQNAFVLRQGLRREHVLAICLVCATSDAALIAAGVAGFGILSARAAWIDPVLRYGGAAFLFAYAARSLVAAARGGRNLAAFDARPAGLGRTLVICLAFTWLNPHVYLDTVVLLGSVASQYPGRKLEFGLGAAAASTLFFFSLGYGARLLRPVFARPAAWRVLDGFVAAAMTAIALRLIA